MIVPRRPCGAPAREQRAVGVQHRLVGLVGEGAEDVGLGGARIGQQRERLVGVGGDHHLVELLGGLAVGHDVDVRGVAGHGDDRRADADAVGEGGGERLDVARGAARDRRPLRAPGERQHPVVGEELRRGSAPGTTTSARGRPTTPRRPGARAGGRRTSARSPRRPGRRAASDRRRGRRAAARGAVEAHVVGHHRQEARPGEVRRLGEQAAEAARGVLEVLGLGADREAHVGRLARDRELVEQRLEARVVAVVEDDEAGVDVPGRIVGVDPDRVRVPADVVARLVDDDLVLGVQEMGGGQPRDARSDDGDPHETGVRTPRVPRINRWRSRATRRRARRRPRAPSWRPARWWGCRRRRRA